MAQALSSEEELVRKFGGTIGAPTNDEEALVRQFGGQLAEPTMVGGLRPPAPTPSERILQAPGRAARAFPQSFANLVSDAVRAVLSPLETAKGVVDIGAGALRNVMPEGLRRLIDQFDKDPQAAERASAAARAAGGALAQRYGSPGAIAETLQTDPAGALSDLSTLLAGGGAAAKAGGAGRTGAALERTAELVNPLSPPVRTVNVLAGAPSNVSQAWSERASGRAGQILGEALGPERFALEDAIRANPNLTPMEAAAAAGILRPQFYALGQAAETLDTENFFARLARQKQLEDVNALRGMAGGETQTQARQAQRAARGAVEARLGPVRETELGAANIAGELEPKFAATEAQMERGAAAKVEDVRRFTAAGERAADLSTRPQAAPEAPPRSTGAPYKTAPSPEGPPPQFTYAGDLAKQAEKVAESAAQGSLLFGEARRFAKAAKESLEAHGHRPLRADEINTRIDDILRDPKYAGERDVERAITRVKEDIAKWTNEGGVIDAWALDKIRQNSVTGAVQELLGQGADSKRGRKLAAKLTAELKPMIVDAIERAGGTGYGDYLRQYSLGLHTVNQRKAAAGLMKMYRDNPKRFQAMVRGDDPKAVEKIFGPGSYDIAVEMAPFMPQLENISKRLARLDDIKDQAAKGQDAINLILQSNRDIFKFPPWLNAKVAFANEVLRRLEGYTSVKTRVELEKAFQTSTNMEQLLAKVPEQQHGALRKAAGGAASLLFSADLTRKGVSAPKVGAAARVQNMLMQDQEQSENALME
jgi:hypothetical protein